MHLLSLYDFRSTVLFLKASFGYIRKCNGTETLLCVGKVAVASQQSKIVSLLKKIALKPSLCSFLVNS